MGFLSDIFFGTDSTGFAPKKKPNNGGWTHRLKMIMTIIMNRFMMTQ